MNIKMIRSLILLSILLTLALFNGNAQEQRQYVRGVVYENTKDLPLMGATVLFMNSNNRIIGGTSTDAEGKFNAPVPEGVVKIGFSFIGLVTQTFDLNPAQQYEIILKEDSQMLTEFVVSANRVPKADLGMLQKDRKDIANAISSVDMAVMENQTASSIDQLLQGAAPGLQITFNSGDPGAGASIRIRGISSLEGNNSPLWIIDGVEVIGGDEYNISSITNFGTNPIGDISPEDVESIDVLKDASATAIYGSRGANGVIVINTKRGTKGKPKFSLSSKITMLQTPEYIPLLNGDQQRMYTIEAQANANGGVDDLTKFPQLRGDMSREDAWRYNNNTNMVDMLTRTGWLHNHSFSLRGGGDRLNYYWSLGYMSEKGTSVGGGYERFTTTVNLDYSLSDKFKVFSKFSYTNALTDKRSWQWPILNVIPMTLARTRAAFLPVYNQDGSGYYADNAGTDKIGPLLTGSRNPVAMINYATYMERVNRFNALMKLDLTVNTKLNGMSQISVDYRQTTTDFFIPSEALGVRPNTTNFNQMYLNDGYDIQLVNNNRLVYKPVDNREHMFMVTGVADLIYKQYSNIEMGAGRSGSSFLQNSSSAAILNPDSKIGGRLTTSTQVSLVADLHYRLWSRYNFSTSLKTEGSSTFGKDNPFSVYPTFGFNWNMNEEAFLKDKEWVGLIKPRFSYGITGKLPSVTNLLSVTYGTVSEGYLGEPYTYIDKFAYDNLHEERTTEFNYGLDWSLFADRLGGEFNYYTRRTEDLLMRQSMATSSGFTDGWVNFGTLKNTGWELGINVVPVSNREAELRWKIFFNIARNRNSMEKLPEHMMTTSYEENLGYGGFQTKLEEGTVIGGLFGYRAKGVYPTDEDAAVRDFNGNIVYDANGIYRRMQYSDGSYFEGGDMIYEDINRDGIINALDVVQIGDANVDCFGMLRNEVTWKQWSMVVSLFYNVGQDVINGMRYELEKMDDRNNQARSIQRRWRKPGDVTDMPRAINRARNSVASTRWIEDASYMKLKEVSLTYNFKMDVVKRLGLTQLGLFCTGENLLTWTKYKGIDPEIGLTSGTMTKVGIDKQATAPPMRFTFGVRASF